MDCENSVYTLDEALASVGFGKFQLLVLSYAGLGWFAEAMENMILSFVGPIVLSQWDLSSSQESLLSTVVFAGVLVGSFSWGLVSDHRGRRVGFLGINLLTSGAGLLSAFSPNYASLVVLRLLVGFGLGGGSVFSSWSLEFVPALDRGKRMFLLAVLWAFGTIFEAGLAWIVMPRLGWRWLLALSSLPAFALLLLCPLLPESPRYLCMKGRTADAHDILAKIALLNHTDLPHGKLVSDSTVSCVEEEESAASEYPPLLISATASRKTADLNFRSGLSSFVSLFSSKLIRTTILLWVLYFGNVFSYYGIILLTSEFSSWQSKCGSTILQSGNLQGDDSLYINVFVTSLAELAGLLLSAIIVDRIGLKLSMVFMSVSAAIFLLPLVYHQSAMMTTVLLSGARMFIEASFCLASIYAQELYPTSVRATGAGAASVVERIGGMVCPLVAVGLVSGCHLTEAIILFEIVISFSAICILLFPFETKGKELNDSVDDISDSCCFG